ncbi:hypothetical protein [Lentzea sp. NPDC051838]|uniref:hypothetical protein n=1 Tax=Lentzea sp. NPDC051838 TaxID=3154849 RepID=UPI00342C7D60
MFWLADQGDPPEWPVVAWGADGSWEQYDDGAVAFLVALVRGTLPSKLLAPRKVGVARERSRTRRAGWSSVETAWDGVQAKLGFDS